MIIHIISSTNTGIDAGEFISSPSYLLRVYLNAGCHHQASLRSFQPFYAFLISISLVNDIEFVPSK